MAEQETGLIRSQQDQPPSTLFDILLNSREKYRDEIANPYVADERGFIDEVIDPAESRIKLIRAFEALETKYIDNPARKHGNIPL